MSTPQVWLITGASSGLGTVLAETVLKAGHKVIATARDPVKAAQTHPQIESLGGKWLQLDITRPDTKETVETAIREVGHIDVVVNNAGYSLLGSIEDMRYSNWLDGYNKLANTTQRRRNSPADKHQPLRPDSSNQSRPSIHARTKVRHNRQCR